MIMQVSDNSISQRQTDFYVSFYTDPLTKFCNELADKVINNVFKIHSRNKPKIKRRRKRK